MGTILDKKQEIIDLYRSGWSCSAIGRRFELETSAVTAFLARAGVRVYLRGRPRLPDEAVDDIAKRYAAGVGTRALAKEYAVSECTIREAARRRGIAPRRTGDHSRVLQPEELALAKALFYEGASLVEIGRRVGCFCRIVAAHLRQAGIEIKPRGRQPKKRYMRRDGYWMANLGPGDAFALPMATKDGQALERRLVMARRLGRPLESHETVHHINGDRSDNRIENLQLRQGRHGRGASFRCRSCGSHDIEAVSLAESTN